MKRQGLLQTQRTPLLFLVIILALLICPAKILISHRMLFPLRGRNRSTIWVYYAIQGKQAFQEYRRHWSELIVKPVIYPTRDICERYSETVLRMICFKESLERENRSLAELRDTLLPKLLSGEIDVSALADNTEANA